MGRRLASLLSLVGAVALLAGPAPARADGDPASDALLGQNVFYPYTAPIPRAMQRTLNAETAEAAHAGWPLKVAIIGAPLDLGAIPELFGKPAPYASFLDREISFNGPQPLLVVMAGGYGTAAVSPRVRAAAAGLGRPAGRSDAALTEAAIRAVPRLAAAAGHPIAVVAVARGRAGTGGSATAVILVALVLGAVFASAALLVRRRRAGLTPTGGGRPAARAARRPRPPAR